MTIAYFDCFAGAAGDMIVAALLDAGADMSALNAALAKLPLNGCTISTDRVRRGALSAVKFNVEPGPHEHSHRHLGPILEMIDAAGLPDRAADRATRVFKRLAEAEAKVHGIDIEKVHFHEVGAIDSIVDIVGACIAMELLEIDRVYCSPIPTGSGTVRCSHGLLPLPAPATSCLLVGAETFPTGITAEVTTPTAAALLTTLTEAYCPLPAMEVSAVGYGAGTREEGPMPNVLRVFVGQDAADGPGPKGNADTVVELSANIDDSTGEMIGATIEALLSGGCLDAWAAPVFMKKSRPAWVVSALCAPGDVADAESILFTETTTFGIRRRTCRRSKLARHWETVETAYGPIRVKIGKLGQRTLTAAPEFTDCAAAARAHHVPVKEVFGAAEAAYRQGNSQ